MIKTFKYVNLLYLKINSLGELRYLPKILLKLEWKSKDLFRFLTLK